MKPYRKERPLEGLSDRELSKRIEGAQRALDKAEAAADSLDSRAIVQGKGAEPLARMDSGLSVLSEAARERQRRQAETPTPWVGLGAKLAREAAQRAKENEPSPGEKAVRYLVEHIRFLPLDGVRFRPQRLSEEQGKELWALSRELDAYLVDRRGSLTAEEKAAIESLLGVAAGAEDYFEKRRQREAAEAELAERRDERRLIGLPPRLKYEAPGSVTLPYHAVVRWLREAQQGDWTIADVGFLAVLLGQFASRESLFPSGRFEQNADGELELVVVVGGRRLFTLGGTINPDREHLGLGRGRIREKECLMVLARNDFFEVEERSGELRVRLGAASRELLREVREGVTTPA